MANITSSLESFMGQIKKATSGVKNIKADSDLKTLTATVDHAVEAFLTKSQAIHRAGSKGEFYRANEALSFEQLANQVGTESLEQLMKECQIPAQFREACMESCAIAMNRSMLGAAGWDEQNKVFDRSAISERTSATPLTSMYPESVVNTFSEAIPSTEAFGANIDMVVPDMKITLTAAIMNFHARIMPRLLHTRTVDQPNISYTKEYLEIYDNSVQDGKSMRLVDLYADPKFARNELQKIVPLKANDVDGNFVLRDGILLFGPQANILKLSLRDDVPGYDKMNRTDLIAENVKLEYVYISLTNSGTTEVFQIPVPESFNRLSRATNAHDSADRIGDFKFRFKLYNNSKRAAKGTTWESADTELLANIKDEEFIAIDVNVKPSINLKRGLCDCQGSFTVKAGHVTDAALIDPATKTLAETLAAAAGHALVGYTFDARFDETNLRKTNISMMTHRVPFSYDIPIGRNYTFDYAIGQVNAEENAANLVKVIGIGQDDVQLTALIKMLENVFDRINNYTVNEENPQDYVGADFVAGDKVRPTIFLGNLDFTKLNIIRDADRTGDVKQRALSYLNGVVARILQLSFMQQQLGASTTATFRCVTSQEVLANVFAPEHIHNHMCKADQRDIGDGVEYILCLPSGVRLEVVTSTFDYMRDKLILVPVIPGNAESELSAATIANNGEMVAHYTISGGGNAAVNHRLFANIRELMVVTNPVGCIINISGLDLVSGINEGEYLRPTINTVEVSPYNA